jgi:hypothetical protein
MLRHVIALLTLAAAVAAEPQAAEQPRVLYEPRVVSPRPDSVTVTIYRDLVALITETRTVDLPAEAVTLEFHGVVDSLIPQSAVLADAGRVVSQSNYDYDRLTPDKLLEKSIGRRVWLTRTSRSTGKVTQVEATLVAASESGVVFRTTDGSEALRCSGLPERLTFTEVPGELRSEPTLSVGLAAGSAGRRQVRVSYLATGFTWHADYVAHLRDGSMDLDGWLTLENLSAASFRDARVQVVAGRLNLLDADTERGSGPYGDSRFYSTDESVEGEREWALDRMRQKLDEAADTVQHFSGCYPLGPGGYATEDIGKFPDMKVAEALQRVVGFVDAQDLEEVVMTGRRESLAARENLADYQMYRLPNPTDLDARQTKQVAFLAKRDVKVDRFYGVRLAQDEEDLGELADGVPAIAKIGWRNVAEDGLGEPLPGGLARFFEAGGRGDVFVGDARLRDSPVGVPIELGIGRSNDLDLRIDNEAQAEVSLDSIDAGAKELMLALLAHRAYIPLSLRIVNAKSRPVTFELRQGPLGEFGDLRVKNASQPPHRKSGDFAWRITVPANGEATLSYEVGGKIHPFGD